MEAKVCSADHAGMLDSGIRRFFHNPKRILRDLIKRGDTVLDIGCGPGTFTVDMAEMVGPKGKVVAADLQSEMLSKAKEKATKHGVVDRMAFHECATDGIGLSGTFSVIVAFFMVHEVPERDGFMKEIAELLKPGGLFYLVEPFFHAGRKLIDEELGLAEKYGMQLMEKRNVLFGKGFILAKKED